MMIIKKKELCINKQNKNITSFKRFDGERRARPSRFSQISLKRTKLCLKRRAASGKVFFKQKKTYFLLIVIIVFS